MFRKMSHYFSVEENLEVRWYLFRGYLGCYMVILAVAVIINF